MFFPFLKKRVISSSTCTQVRFKL